ncbi:hypothetical protein N9W89_05810 [Hellea sp.]|nr:hypothetical protein [Hellea sp.]
MKKLFLSLGLVLILGGFAQAKTPPEVLKPYKEYRAALTAGDASEALRHGYTAWQTSEELLGDAKITGDLAQNYALIKNESDDKQVRKRQETAYKRAWELTSKYGVDAPIMYLERGINMMNFYLMTGNNSKAYGTSKKLSKYAEANSLTTSTFYAEALTQQAGYYAARAKHAKAEKVAEKALAAFSNVNDDYATSVPILANLYQGYGLEGQDMSMEAAFSYQKVMESLDGIGPDEHPLAAKALGRWSHMRAVLKSEGKLEEAENKGLCKCWPYDKPRNESLKPIKRVPPKMPRKAYVSGFSIVQFDVDDGGSPINTEILVSWPKDLYEQSSLKSMEGWEYTPRTAEETDGDRQGLVTTIRYMLRDNSGNILY